VGAAITIAVAVTFGLVIGSFLNVVMWRVPRGESVVSPGSHCPECDHPLGGTELVPVFSWAAQRGRCRHCGTGVSVRYPLVELACGVAAGLMAWLLVSA
jgi:leader peptidase (prepilin peptidase)/N-methyltransferase